MYEYIDFFEGNYQKGDMNQRKVYHQKAISLSNEDEYAGIDGLLTKGRPSKVYALYKGDKFLDLGTTKELAIKYNMSVKSILWYHTATARKRDKGNGLILIDIPEGEDEEE